MPSGAANPRITTVCSVPLGRVTVPEVERTGLLLEKLLPPNSMAKMSSRRLPLSPKVAVTSEPPQVTFSDFTAVRRHKLLVAVTVTSPMGPPFMLNWPHVKSALPSPTEERLPFVRSTVNNFVGSVVVPMSYHLLGRNYRIWA